VFEPFTQLDGSLARRFQGSGLGLYMCRTLIAAHDGELRLTSRVGEGTTVMLRLPASRVIPLSPAPGETSVTAKEAR
jgi:signal transduction histidine kinase